jgi:hypothetical protein
MKTTDKEKFIKSMEDLKSKIEAVQAGVKALKETGRSEDMIYHMIQKASPTVGKAIGGLANKSPVPIKTIKAIVQGLDRLYEVTFPERE